MALPACKNEFSRFSYTRAPATPRSLSLPSMYVTEQAVSGVSIRARVSRLRELTPVTLRHLAKGWLTQQMHTILTPRFSFTHTIKVKLTFAFALEAASYPPCGDDRPTTRIGEQGSWMGRRAVASCVLACRHPRWCSSFALASARRQERWHASHRYLGKNQAETSTCKSHVRYTP